VHSYLAGVGGLSVSPRKLAEVAKEALVEIAVPRSACGGDRMNQIRYEFPEQDIYCSGHNGCPGCGEALTMRWVLNTMGPKTIAVIPPSCINILSGAQPLSAMRIPAYMTAFENSAASAAGISRALRRQGKDDVNVLVLAGDGVLATSAYSPCRERRNATRTWSTSA